jgi:hypothetical protein
LGNVTDVSVDDGLRLASMRLSSELDRAFFRDRETVTSADEMAKVLSGQAQGDVRRVRSGSDGASAER